MIREIKDSYSFTLWPCLFYLIFELNNSIFIFIQSPNYSHLLIVIDTPDLNNENKMRKDKAGGYYSNND